jgi:hypothetical protein
VTRFDAETVAAAAAKKAATIAARNESWARMAAVFRDLRAAVVAAEDATLAHRPDDALAELEYLRGELRYWIDLVEHREIRFDPTTTRQRWVAHYAPPAERLPRPARKPGPPVIPPATPR